MTGPARATGHGSLALVAVLIRTMATTHDRIGRLGVGIRHGAM
jgi:hypothetical protein